jgi:hypothetical protein
VSYSGFNAAVYVAAEAKDYGKKTWQPAAAEAIGGPPAAVAIRVITVVPLISSARSSRSSWPDRAFTREWWTMEPMQLLDAGSALPGDRP